MNLLDVLFKNLKKIIINACNMLIMLIDGVCKYNTNLNFTDETLK